MTRKGPSRTFKAFKLSLVQELSNGLGRRHIAKFPGQGLPHYAALDTNIRFLKDETEMTINIKTFSILAKKNAMLKLFKNLSIIETFKK